MDAFLETGCQNLCGSILTNHSFYARDKTIKDSPEAGAEPKVIVVFPPALAMVNSDSSAGLEATFLQIRPFRNTRTKLWNRVSTSCARLKAERSIR